MSSSRCPIPTPFCPENSHPEQSGISRQLLYQLSEPGWALVLHLRSVDQQEAIASCDMAISFSSMERGMYLRSYAKWSCCSCRDNVDIPVIKQKAQILFIGSTSALQILMHSPFFGSFTHTAGHTQNLTLPGRSLSCGCCIRSASISAPL